MKLRHPFTRALYETTGEGLVRVDDGAGHVGLFHPDGRWHSGVLREADPHLLGWVGGPLLGGGVSPAARAELESPERPAADPKAVSYQDLLDRDTRPVPEVLRRQAPADLPLVRVPIERYTSRAFHEREVERLWRRVWQMACREEELALVGDHVLYEIAGDSLVILRSAPGEIRAFHNSCLHRGRALRDCDGRVGELRCPFHGWTWGLDGRLLRVPAAWDFPELEPARFRLPEARVGTWGGFVFVNLDPACAPLEEHLGDLSSHFAPWPLERRYKEAHVAKRLPCNWKVAQEAFMEAYHVGGTHPQLLPGIGDVNSQYDVWGNFSRAITANMTPSPLLGWAASEQDMLDSLFSRSLDSEPVFRVPAGMTARQTLAAAARAGLQASVPNAESLSDAELADSFYYTVFPNFHPWGAYNRIVYRFRPDGGPDRCLMEVIYLAPFSGERPMPAPVHLLADDEDWTCAPELGFLTRVFNQDTYNLGRVQRGLHAARHTHVTFARYQETKIRHFHALLERWLT
ncbi:MAG TPA: aromatic ring-hydroxylating dioxygenase subunit alpha [Myxococcota bacterium]|nr:aromatic ring-hydroxylating dioxygenase subunit alpha [Myxococcota bacterium]